VIKSYIDRYPFSVALYNQIIGEWNKTKRFLKTPRGGKQELKEEYDLAEKKDSSLIMTNENDAPKKKAKKIHKVKKTHHSKTKRTPY